MVQLPPEGVDGFEGREALRRAIIRQLSPLIRACGLEVHEIGCRLIGDQRALVVEITGPSELRRVEHTVGVRVLDAIHAEGSTFGPVTVCLLD